MFLRTTRVKTTNIPKIFSNPQRSFVLGYDNTNIKNESGEFKTRIYKKYIPSKTVLLEYKSSEGKMAKIYEWRDNFTTMKNLWLLSVPASAGIGAYLHQMVGLGAFYYYMPHLIIAPLAAKILNSALVSWPGSKNIKSMYLLENGHQILLQTFDGVWRKINIQDIENHKMIDKKSHMLISIKNNDRNYVLSTKNKKHVNFEILDKIIKGVCVQTGSAKKRAWLPSNISRESVEFVNPAQILGLNPNQPLYSEEEQHIIEQFKKFKIPLYSEKDFYKTHKISRSDFLNKISELSSEEKEQEILKLYEDKSIKGRGVELTKLAKDMKEILESGVKKPRYSSKLRDI